MARFVFLSHLDINLYRFRLPLMKALVARRHTVFAACPRGEVSPRFASHHIIHLAYPLVREGMNPLREAGTMLALARLLKRTRPDVLHTFTIKPNVYGSLAGRLAQVPAIVNSVTGLGTFHVETPRGVRQWSSRYFLNVLYRLSLHRSKAVIFQNDDDHAFFMKGDLVREGQTVIIRGSGVDTAIFRPPLTASERAAARERIPGLQDKVVVCLVSRLIQDKGVAEYLEAARILCQTHGSGLRFLLVGDYDDGNPKPLSRSLLNDYIAEGTITYLGFRDDIQELLRAVDVYCLPSYREGMPMSILEAMATGLPIVASDAAGCRDTVEDGMNGIKVPVKDIRRLCQALDIMIRDKELRIAMGRKSREKAEREFSLEIVLKEHMELYDRILETLGSDERRRPGDD